MTAAPVAVLALLLGFALGCLYWSRDHDRDQRRIAALREENAHLHDQLGARDHVLARAQHVNAAQTAELDKANAKLCALYAGRIKAAGGGTVEDMARWERELAQGAASWSTSRTTPP